MIFVVKNVLQKFLFKNLSNIIFGQKTSCPKKMSWGIGLLLYISAQLSWELLSYLLNLTLKDFQGGVVNGEMLGIRLISAQLSWDLG